MVAKVVLNPSVPLYVGVNVSVGVEVCLNKNSQALLNLQVVIPEALEAAKPKKPFSKGWILFEL